MSDIDEYLAGVPEPQLSTLLTVRERLRALMPDAVEAIAYGVPAFVENGSRVAGYASAKKHCSYFPMSGTVLEQIDLGDLDWSKGTLRFPVDEPLSEALLTELVRVRRAEIAAGKH